MPVGDDGKIHADTLRLANGAYRDRLHAVLTHDCAHELEGTIFKIEIRLGSLAKGAMADLLGELDAEV
ncbi:MAG TPA: hypothetical protein VMM17_12995 [Gemmatimonadaceae bacterium]|nr:hypothetical protein [Gemmatimonadaceae bacterium]